MATGIKAFLSERFCYAARMPIGLLILLLIALPATASDRAALWQKIEPYFTPPQEYAGDLGKFRPLLKFENGDSVDTPAEWAKRREELLQYWQSQLGQWPPLLEKPVLENMVVTNREGFQQRKVKVQIAPDQHATGYLLVPSGKGPFPAVFVPYYEPETSVGLSEAKLRDFAYQLTKRGFVTLSIGSPGGDARKPDKGQAQCQPLYYLAYVAANCANALANLPEVDPQRIGVVGHSYGGKWAMFAAAFYPKFAAAAWSDPGIVFDESRPNVNYWEPWYLGLDPETARKPGVPNENNPRTGPYKNLFESGRDLHEVMALIAPRPFLVSGGSEDPAERWRALNHIVGVNELLGHTDRVAMTTRPKHDPTSESNEVIYQFFEYFLGRTKPQEPSKE